MIAYRCPDCRANVTTTSALCWQCGRAIRWLTPVLNLLPSRLDVSKHAEDAASPGDDVPTWRRLFYGKREWLERCEAWLPTACSMFLELGGGLCYASALVKARCPKATVVATDVSPRYLETHALKVGDILGTPADQYAAVDAEALPFADRQFDAVYAQIMLYRLPDPLTALREIRRVLAPGGRFVGIERASPWLPPWSEWERREMLARADANGTRERPWTYRDWARLAREVGATVTPVPGRRVRAPWLRRAGNAGRMIHVMVGMTGET